ncbi:MAG: HAD family hydrolase [Actinomycetota bacterium]|nr:HAD family phosphatase [Actinomycetota bacterium]
MNSAQEVSQEEPAALIVDFGGVLTTSVIESFAQFCQDHGVDPETLKKVLSLEAEAGALHPLHMVETGQWQAAEFNAHLSERLSIGRDQPIEAHGLKDRLFAAIRPEPSVVMAVKRVREAGYLTALLSNSWGADGYPRETFDDLFDQVVLSGEVGLRKPHAEIYELAAQRLGVPASRCVFVDDLAINTKGAEAVGMIAIHHKDPVDTVREIERLFGLSDQT